MAEGVGAKKILLEKIKKLCENKTRCKIFATLNVGGHYTGYILEYDDECVLFRDKFNLEIPIRISAITAIQEEGVKDGE